MVFVYKLLCKYHAIHKPNIVMLTKEASPFANPETKSIHCGDPSSVRMTSLREWLVFKKTFAFCNWYCYCNWSYHCFKLPSHPSGASRFIGTSFPKELPPHPSGTPPKELPPHPSGTPPKELPPHPSGTPPKEGNKKTTHLSGYWFLYFIVLGSSGGVALCVKTDF